MSGVGGATGKARATEPSLTPEMRPRSVAGRTPGATWPGRWCVLGVFSITLAASTPRPANALENGGAGWVGITLRAPFAGRYAFSLQTEPRFFEQPERQRVLLLRPWFDAALSHGLSVGLGYDALLLLFPEAQQEHRLWQQVAHTHRFVALGTRLRFRLEQRFFSVSDSLSVRARVLGGIEVPIVREVEFVLNDELFLSFNEIPGIDPSGPSENRLIVGFGWGPRDWARVVLAYQNQWLRQLDLLNHTLLLRLDFELPTP